MAEFTPQPCSYCREECVCDEAEKFDFEDVAQSPAPVAQPSVDPSAFALDFIRKQFGPCPEDDAEEGGPQDRWMARVGLVSHALSNYLESAAAATSSSVEGSEVTRENDSN